MGTLLAKLKSLLTARVAEHAGVAALAAFVATIEPVVGAGLTKSVIVAAFSAALGAAYAALVGAPAVPVK
jgi:hypothetical protein